MIGVTIVLVIVAPFAAPRAWTDDLLGFTDALRAGRYRTSV